MPKPKVCLLIPVFNHSRALAKMLPQLKAFDLPCLLIDDGSRPLEAAALVRLAKAEKSWVTLDRLAENQGKGGAVLRGVAKAIELGYSHALQIDADGQHDPAEIPAFLRLLRFDANAVLCGQPQYDRSAPLGRLCGRWLTTVWIWINTLSFEIADGMCGYRLYPLAPIAQLSRTTELGRAMDFDIEILVRLKWQGLRIVGLPVQVRYPVDGTSNFRLLRDNILISRMHARLFFAMLVRSPQLLRARWAGRGSKN